MTNQPKIVAEWNWQPAMHPSSRYAVYENLIWRGLVLGTIEAFNDAVGPWYGNIGDGRPPLDYKHRTGPIENHDACRRRVEANVLQALNDGLGGEGTAGASAEPVKAGDEVMLREALKTAIGHIEHMSAWIALRNAGYSFESLGEDMPGMKNALSSQEAKNEVPALHDCSVVSDPVDAGVCRRSDSGPGDARTCSAAGGGLAAVRDDGHSGGRAGADGLTGALSRNWKTVEEQIGSAYGNGLLALLREYLVINSGPGNDLAPLYVARISAILSTPDQPLGDLFNELVRRMNFDGAHPRGFTLGELQRAIDGAEFPK